MITRTSTSQQGMFLVSLKDLMVQVGSLCKCRITIKECCTISIHVAVKMIPAPPGTPKESDLPVVPVPPAPPPPPPLRASDPGPVNQ